MGVVEVVGFSGNFEVWLLEFNGDEVLKALFFFLAVVEERR